MNKKILLAKSKCRYCKHHPRMHLDSGECNTGWLSDIANNHCHCIEYEPSDNLEYLEMKYEEKQCL